MNKIHSALLAAVLCVGLCAGLAATSAMAAEDPGPFAKGQKQFTVVAGGGDAFNDSYIVLGIGGNYFLTDGLNVGLQLEAWLDGDPSIYKYSALMNYVFYQVPRVHPYAGALVRYTDIDGLDGLKSVGGRAGVLLSIGRNGYAGIGGVYESYLDCNTRTYVSCDTTYPEFTVAFSF